ncbi:MAG: hypothetical protein JRI35_06090 [Deltaproteobacteria bacterium]|nr:hypothetical protein [Deltaproteobacteria bacterium]
MDYTRKGWAGIRSLVVVFSFVVLLVAAGGVAAAADEESGHDTAGLESVHDTAAVGGHETASPGEEAAAGHEEGHGAP